jgi:uncharacterized protein (TIGR01244 family)
MSFRSLSLALFVAALALAGCATPRGQALVQAPPVMPSGLAVAQPLPGLYVAGQPSVGDWSAFAGIGVRTVVNLRTPDEMGDQDERAAVEAAGMRYVEIPVAGLDGITAENGDRLAELLRSVSGDVLLHCASGNRAGALLAVALVQRDMPAEAALALGRMAGMKSAEARARAVLGMPAASCPAPTDAATGGSVAQCP